MLGTEDSTWNGFSSHLKIFVWNKIEVWHIQMVTRHFKSFSSIQIGIFKDYIQGNNLEERVREIVDPECSNKRHLIYQQLC